MRPQFRFSLRSLFWLMTVSAVVLGTMTALGRTHSFRALGSWYAYMALIPIAMICVGWRAAWLTGSNLTRTAIALYCASFALPAVRWDGYLVLGYWTFLYSFLGITYFGETARGVSLPTACLLGVVANVCFVITLTALALNKVGPNSDIHRPSLPGIGLLCSAVLVLPLSVAGALDNIYIGYGVWVAAMLALWLRVREEQEVTSSLTLP